MNSRSETFRLVLHTILLAIIIVQAMVPWLGFIPLGFISLTVTHITVTVVAVMLGSKDGMVIGLFWEIATIVRAYVMPTTPSDTLVLANPIISAVSGVLVGLVTGPVFHWIYQKSKSITISSAFAGVSGSLADVVLVLGFMGLFYTGVTADAHGVGSALLFKTLVGVAIINGIPEAVGTGIIAPLPAKALFTATSLRLE